MTWQKVYEKWVNDPNMDVDLHQQLLELSETERKECFYQNLSFGTGGLRGELGPGTNRLNIYTIRKASEGLAHYIEAAGETAKKKGVVIAHDPRHFSDIFTLEAAKVLGTRGIPVYLFPNLHPTPMLSFAVRYLGAYAGVVITASHNPPTYNGYKVYGEDGGQLTPKAAEQLIQYVNNVKDELAISTKSIDELKAQKLVHILDNEVDQAYQQQLKEQIVLDPELLERIGNQLNIVFTPLHGTTFIPLSQALQQNGFTQVTIVKEQEQPDPEFSTVESPNPEEHAAFKLAIEYGEREQADILLGTDPDGDRLGVVARDQTGQYQVLTGNQTGALMLDYLLKTLKQKKRLPENGAVIKTIVTSEIGRKIAEKYQLATFDTLTGFKFIGEKIKEFQEKKSYQFLFGYEESYGYLIGDFVRDKDAIQAGLFVCEVAAHYKEQGKNLYGALEELFQTYGYYQEDLISRTYKGMTGHEKIFSMMEQMRNHPKKIIADRKVIRIEDYQTNEAWILDSDKKESLNLPSSNVLKYVLEGEAWFCLRPSGTEPKIKFYFGVCEESQLSSIEELAKLKKEVLGLFDE